MRRPARSSFVAVLLVAAACGDSTSSSNDSDLAVPLADSTVARDAAGPAPDLAAVDLSVAAPADLAILPDLAGPDYAGYTFCAGTRVAATCAQAFFEPIASCFAPMGGCRTATSGDTTSACWQAGTLFSTTYLQATGGSHLLWAGGATCMEGDVTPRKGRLPLFAVTAGGSTLSYDQDSGDVTCPDGSHVFLGNAFGDCLALGNLLQPPIKNCQAGICP